MLTRLIGQLAWRWAVIVYRVVWLGKATIVLLRSKLDAVGCQVILVTSCGSVIKAVSYKQMLWLAGKASDVSARVTVILSVTELLQLSKAITRYLPALFTVMLCPGLLPGQV